MLAGQLLTSRWASLELTPDETRVIEHVFETARTFFESPQQEKIRFSLPGQLEGWRDLCAEFSHSPDRPDLNEAFGLVDRNRSRTADLGWIERNPLHATLRRAMGFLTPKVDAFFEELRLAIAPDGDPLRASDWSYLQVNYYRPARESRDLLQDEHEDGHLVTVLSADQPGLEIEVDGAFRPAPRDPNTLIVMPGSILTQMTGGRIAPLRHRVRRQAGVESRTSVMYFVNPSLDAPPRAWLQDADGRRADIREAAIAMSTAFGLPPLDCAAMLSEVAP